MKTISIFISSTFNDMNLERDIIREHVLPMLKERYNKQGIEILVFDLRWGIFTKDESTEKQKEKEILQSCFQIIDMCHPFFIAFLGNRLGWVPKEDIIEELSITDIYTKKMLKSQSTLSVTHLEIEYGVLNRKNFSKSLVFYREEESYIGLRDDKLTVYIEDNPDNMSVLNKRKEIIHNSYIEAGYSENIVDYRINLFEPSKSAIYELSQVICKNITRIIDKEASNKSEDALSQDEIYLANYQEPSLLVNEICKDIDKNEHILIYGDEGFGKTSLSLVLKKKISERFKVLYYSSDYSEPLSVSKIIKGWTSIIIGDLNLPDLDSIEKEWSRFLSLLANSILEKVVIIIDGFDKEIDFANSNIFFLPSVMAPKIQYIILSRGKLSKWERRFHISNKQIKGLTKDEVMQYIGMTCYNNGKNLPQDIIDELSGKYIQDNYSPVELSIMLNYIITLDRDDFERINSNELESNENKIHRYLLESIHNMPCSYSEKIAYIINKVIIKYGEDSLTPFKYIALSLNGLSTDDFHKINILGFDFISFLLVRNAFKPYLSTFNNNGKWHLQNNEFRNSILKCINESERQEIFLNLSNCNSLIDERLYYSLFSNNLKDALQIYVNKYKYNMQLYNGYLLTYFANSDNILPFVNEFNDLSPENSYTAYSQLICRFYSCSINNGTTVDSKILLNILIDSLNRNTIIDPESKSFLLGSVEDTLAYLLASSHDTEDIEKALKHMRQAVNYYILSKTNEQRIQYIEKSINQINSNGHV